MTWALLIVFFGIAGGNAIITGADIQVVPVGTEAECTAAKARIDTAAQTGYAKWLTVCFEVRE